MIAQLPIKKTTELQKDFIATLMSVEATIKNLEKISNPTYDNVLLPFMSANERLNQAFHPLSHYNGVKNTKILQRIMDKALVDLSAFHTRLFQNENIYNIFKAVIPRNDEEKRAWEQILRDFEFTGVGKSEEVKKRLGEIDELLSQCENRFSQNVLDATDAYELIIHDETVLGEMGKGDKAAAKCEREGKEVYRFTLRAPSYIPFMTYCIDRSLREEMYKAYSTRAPQNGDLLEEILALRHERATLLGFANFAELSTALKEAGEPFKVNTFLEELLALSLPKAQSQKEELEIEAKREGIEILAPFDSAYLSEKIRKRDYDLDEEVYRPYFEANYTLNASFSLFEQMFGVRFVDVSVPTWHKDVRVFDIYEGDTLKARLYADLFARAKKRGGAWMDHYTSRGLDENGILTLPVAHIVCNFPAPLKNIPSLLRPSEVETLFHEMGHALHHLLSTTNTLALSGVNGVDWDVVEFPSQFLELFIYETDVLAMITRHYETGETLPHEMIIRLKSAKNFHSALMMVRQVEFSLFDMKVHEKNVTKEEVQAILDTIRMKTALVPIPTYNKFQHGFTHIFAGGYAAGYYSYKWAEVLSADAFEIVMKSENWYQKVSEYKEKALSLGGSIAMATLFENFAGRKVDASALLRINGI